MNAIPAPLAAPPPSRGVSPAQIAATLAISAVIGLTLAASGDWKVALGLVAVGAFSLLGLLRPALFVAVFLLVRPLLDDFGQSSAGVPSGNVSGGIGVLLIAVFVVAIATSRRPVFVPDAARALLAVVLVSLLAAAQSRITLGDSTGLEPVTEMVRLFALLAIYLLAANLFGTPAKARNLFLLVVLSAFVPTIVGLVELAGDPAAAENSEIARISGTFVGPNPFGGFLAIAALLLIFLPPERLSQLVRWCGLVAILVALAATYSRMGWVILLAGLVLLGWRDRKAVVMAGAAVAVAVAVAVPAIRERAVPFAVPEEKLAQSGEGYESFDWRIDNWNGLLEKWTERPVFGYGLQSTPYVNPRRQAENVGSASGGFDAHNMVVRTLVEGGVVLLLVYIAFFTIVLASVRRMRRRRWPLSEHARLVHVLWLLVILIGLTTDDPFGFSTLMYTMLALTGALEGAYRYWRRGREAEDDDPVPVADRPRTLGPALPAGAGSD